MTAALMPDNARAGWQALAQHLDQDHLESLALGLTSDDPKLLQGATTMPPPLPAISDWPVEGACAITYCAWRSGQVRTLGEADDFFARKCFEMDEALCLLGIARTAGCRFFLNWWDQTERQEARAVLLAEVTAELNRRRALEDSLPSA